MVFGVIGGYVCEMNRKGQSERVGALADVGVL